MDSTKYSNIKSIILNVGGVFTDGTKTYNNVGNVVYKTFIDKDFEALIKLSKCFDIIIVSTCGAVSPAVFKKQGFGVYVVSNKKKKVNQIIRAKGLTPDECIYVGSGLGDLPCVHMIPISFCSRDSCDEVRGIATPLSVASGRGVVYCLYRVLLPEITIRYKFYK